MAYNPFSKPIGTELLESDLQVLLDQSISEGFFVEYKKELTEKGKIAKCIASFANTYGGWYFVGIDADKVQNKPIEIAGISIQPNPLDQFRDVVKTHIDPVPFYHLQSIKLANGNVVLAAYIPADQETPFISSDGKIYRRNQSSSDPVAEDKRHIVDKLYENGKEVKERFARFCSDDRWGASNEGSAWVNISIAPKPLGLFEEREMWSLEYLEKLINSSAIPLEMVGDPKRKFQEGEQKPTASLPFYGGYFSFDSITLRQAPRHPVDHHLSMVLFMDGKARIHVPLLAYPDGVISLLNTVKTQSLLTDIATAVDDTESNIHLLNIFDARKTLNAISVLLNFYFHWIGEKSLHHDFRCGVEVTNLHRHAAFIDSTKWKSYLDKFGWPMIDKEKIELPYPIKGGFQINSEERKDIAPWQLITGYISAAIGVPLEIYASEDKTE